MTKKRENFDPSRVFCIAEAGVNHNGDLAMAKQLVDVAAGAGADAVKFQTFWVDELVSSDANLAPYQLQNTKGIRSQYDMLRTLELSEEAHFILKEYCEKKRILFLSTPHSGEKSAEFLLRLGMNVIKVASGDITNFPLLHFLGSKKVTVLLSTGMSTLKEVKDAKDTLFNSGCETLLLLQCTSEYPSPSNHVNLRVMKTLEANCGVSVGFSDHTLGWEAAALAVRLGARCVEKHITLSHSLVGPDHKASMEPKEFEEFVNILRREKDGVQSEIDPKQIEVLLGSEVKEPTQEEKETRLLVRKSIYTRETIAKGTVFQAKHLIMKRPANGISAAQYRQVLGKRAKRDLTDQVLLKWEDLS